jgi:hypothetical protein
MKISHIVEIKKTNKQKGAYLGICTFPKIFPSKEERVKMEKNGWFFTSHNQLALFYPKLWGSKDGRKVLFNKHLVAFGTCTKSFPRGGGFRVQSYFIGDGLTESMSILLDSSLSRNKNKGDYLALMIRLDPPQNTRTN